MHHQNGPKMDPKWTQNGPKMDPKMDPKWTQNGPKMDPEWTQNGPKMDPHGDTHINAFGAWHTYKRGSPRIPVSHHQLCPKFCIVMNSWITSTRLPMQYLIEGSRSSFQGTIQKMKLRETSRARDWWLLHHRPKIIVSMKDLPNWLFSLHRSHLIVRTPIIFIFDGMQIVWETFHEEDTNIPKYYRIFVDHPVQEWSGSWRQFWFCFGVRIHLIVFNNESVRVLCVHNGSPRSIFHQYIRSPLLRRPSFLNITFWVGWWVWENNGSPRSIVLLSLRTKKRLTFVSGFLRTFWCSRR